MAAAAVIRGLALSCHPLPTLAVTGISAGLAAMADNTLARGALLTVAVFTGQLSIGWSNDWIDSARDRANQRSDKPVALGAVEERLVATAGWVALAATVLASLALGHRAGPAALVVVVCGWAYNVGLKATWASWLPYAIAFGALPAVATLASKGSHWPGAWALAAGATLGVAAHLANVLPDLADDAATGVRGLPHRLGARATSVAGPLLLVAATALIVFGPDGRPSPAGWIAMAASVLIGGGAVWLAGADSAARRALDRRYFFAVIGVAVLDLVLFGVSGGKLG